MKLKITPDQYKPFLKAITQAEKIASVRTPLPVLSAVLLTAQKDTFTIQANNLEQAILLSVSADVLEIGQAGVDAGDFLRIANLGSSVEVESNEKGATIKCGGTFKIPVLPPADFPPLPEIENAKTTTFTAAELIACMSVVYAASDEQARYIINGVHLSPSEKQGVATNGRMLALSSFPVAKDGYGPIIPTKACLLMAAIAKNAGSFEFDSTDAWACLRCEGLAFYSKLIEGNYPNFRQVIGAGQVAFGIKVKRDGLIEALNRASIAKVATNQVKLTLDKSSLSLVAVGQNAESEIHVDLEEKAVAKAIGFSIGLDSKYLSQIAGGMTEEVISLEFVDQLSPAIIRGGGFAVLSPMRMS